MTRVQYDTTFVAGTEKYKPYPTYKDSGVEWLGEIPAHWEVAPVYARYEVALGKMLDEKRIRGESSGPYIRNVDVQWDSVNTQDLPTMDFFPRERKRYGLLPGDLLVCEGGEVGRTATWQGKIEECFFQKAIHRVRTLSEKDIPRFFFYLMRFLAASGVFVAGSNPNTINHLTAIQLRHYRALFPPRSEQVAVSFHLDRETTKIDALVAKKERLIGLLEEKRTALITRAVTKGLDPDVPMKDSGVEWLGEIPVHWNVKQLRWAITFQRGHDLPADDREEGDVPLVSSSGMSSKHSRAVAVAPGIVTGRYGTIGQFYLMDQPYWPLNTTLYSIDLHGNKPRFLRFMLMNLAPLFLLHAVKSAVPGVDRNDIHADHTALPNWAEQHAIADYLDREMAKIDALLAKIQEAIDRLKELRTALISAAVTGKIDVRETAA